MHNLERISPANIGLLTNVEEEVFDAPINGPHLAAILAAGGHILLVAMEEGRVVGQCLGVVLHGPDRAPMLYIDNLGVTPNRRRQGIARDLVQEMLKLGRQEGCKSGWLASDPDSDDALPFYRSIGLSFRGAAFSEFDLL